MGSLLGTCLAALRSSGSHALGRHSHLKGRVSAELQWGRNGQRACPTCTGALPASHSVPVSWSVHLSGLSFCVCILSSALPSLLAPPLVSSSLTCWQDEVPRLPPGAHSPRSAPRAAGGGWLAAAWPCGPQSKWTDTSSPVWPWVWLWGADSSTHRETPPCTCMGPRGVSRVRGLSGLVNLALLYPTEVSQETPVLEGSPIPHSYRGPGPFGSVSLSMSLLCLSLSLLCPVHLVLLLVHSSSTIPTLGGGLLPGARGFVHCLGEQVETLLSAHVLPRPVPIPMPWGAVSIWGNVCCEEWGSRMCVSEGVFRRL